MNGLLTAQEAARLLKVHINTLRRYIETGKLKAFPIGGPGLGKRWRIKQEDLETFINEQGGGK